MKFRATIGKVFSVLALLGLVLGPFVRPIEARPMTMQTEQAAMAMPDGMPCCPDEAPVKDCAKTCPLMAICMAAGLQAMLPAYTLMVPQTAASMMMPTNDAGVTGLASGPPPRPPKT